jgi:hypothetical protein
MLIPKKSKAGFTGRNAVSTNVVLTAPLGGLNTRDPLALMGQKYATVLENWFPSQGSVELRKGMTEWGTGIPGTVGHLAAWVGPTTEKLFAFSSAGVFDATAVGAVGASVSATISGDMSTVMFNTTGGSFLWCVNGVDDARYYNGTSWTTTASYTVTSGGSVNSNLFSVVHSFKRRLFALEKASMNFYYFDIDSIAGSVSRFPLGALFSAGGSLVAMGNWTTSGGLTIDDYVVFVSSEGQAVVYQGTDPGDATAWKLQGVYNIGKPLGKNCTYKLGADLWVLTEFGLTSMSKVLAASVSSEATTLTSPISPTFRELAARGRDLPGWQVVTSKKDNLLLINTPQVTLPAIQFACNLSTQAWASFVGWNASAWAEALDGIFFASNGKVYKAWTDTDDAGKAITAVAKTAWVYLSPRGTKKQVKLVRPTMQIEGRVIVDAAVDADFNTPFEYAPAFASSSGLFSFDNPASLWGSAEWGKLPETRLDWLSLPCSDGHCFSFRFRLIARSASVSWFTTDCVYESGQMLG